MTRWQRFVICTNGETFDIDWTSYSQKGIMFVFYANIWSSIWFQQKSVPRINHVVFQGSTGFHTFVFVFNMIKTTFIGFQIFFWLNTSVIDFSNQQIWVMDFPKKLLLYWIIFPDMTDFQFSFHQIFSTSEDRDQLLVRAIKMFPFFCTSFLKSEWFLLGLTGVDWVFNCVIFFLGLWSIAAGGRPRRPGAPDDVDFSSVVSSQREEGEGKNEEERNHVTVKCNNRNMRKRRRRRRDEEWKKTWKTKTSSRRRRRCAGKWRSAGRASVFDRPPELSVLCVTSSPIARQQFGFVFFFTEFPRVFLAWTGPLEQPSFRTSTVEVGVPSVCSNRSRNLQLVAVIDNVTDRRCGRVRSNGYRRFWCWSRFSISTVNSRADPARNERCRQPIGLTPSPVITWLFPNPFFGIRNGTVSRRSPPPPVSPSFPRLRKQRRLDFCWIPSTDSLFWLSTASTTFALLAAASIGEGFTEVYRWRVACHRWRARLASTFCAVWACRHLVLLNRMSSTELRRVPWRPTRRMDLALWRTFSSVPCWVGTAALTTTTTPPPPTTTTTTTTTTATRTARAPSRWPCPRRRRSWASARRCTSWWCTSRAKTGARRAPVHAPAVARATASRRSATPATTAASANGASATASTSTPPNSTTASCVSHRVQYHSGRKANICSHISLFRCSFEEIYF